MVAKFMQDLHGKDYHSYIDKWYTSEKLFDRLERNGTAICGTTRLNHKEESTLSLETPMVVGAERKIVTF